MQKLTNARGKCAISETTSYLYVMKISGKKGKCVIAETGYLPVFSLI
jgi:hypothetical protein